MIVSCCSLLGMRQISDKSCIENQNTIHVKYPFENCVSYKIIVEYRCDLQAKQLGRPQECNHNMYHAWSVLSDIILFPDNWNSKSTEISE